MNIHASKVWKPNCNGNIFEIIVTGDTCTWRNLTPITPIRKLPPWIIVIFFVNFYKSFICVEFKPFFIVQQIKQFNFWKACLLVVPVNFDLCFPVIQGRYTWTIQKITCLFFKNNKTNMEIFSGVYGGFKVTKPNKFSNVQKVLKLWLTMVAINFWIYVTIFPCEELLFLT